MLQVPPSSPGTTRNVGASNDDEIPVTLPYNPFADQSGSGQDATSNLDRYSTVFYQVRPYWQRNFTAEGAP